MKSLRLIAARAHCDLVVVFDYGYRIERSVNGWAALNILILPALFTPQVDEEIESYVDAYVIDVRNGYLYGQTSDSTRNEESSLTIWSQAGERHVEAQWTRLIEATRERIGTVLAEPEDQAPPPSAEPPPSESAPAVEPPAS
jgi:hypothetical protein